MSTDYHSTFFRFRALPVGTEDRNYADLFIEHLESILLLGDFFAGSRITKPTAIGGIEGVCNRPVALFRDIGRHFWVAPAAETTKQHLRIQRRTGNVDEFYDIDVLRMTEPRLIFIRDTLRRFNELPIKHRLSIIDQIADCRYSYFDVKTALNETFSQHLSDIISSSILFEGQTQLNIDGFRYLKLPSESNSVTINRTHKVDIFLSFFKIFSSLIDFEIKDGAVHAFALRNVEHWLRPSAGEPFEILGVLSRDCNARCDFCYVLGNPSNTAIKLQKFSSKKSGDEARIRLKYFASGYSFPAATYDTEEIITHPDFLAVCRDIRASSNKCISITTNGFRLDERLIREMKKLEPVDFSISLNAMSPDIRTWLMGKGAHRGIRALELLDEMRIPCALTVAAWPRVPIEEIVATIEYAAQFRLRSISLLLGGFTKYFPNPPEYLIPQYWNYVIDAVAELRTRIRVPFIIQPRLYEEQYRFGDRLGSSLITGVNPGSPADLAGLKVYDEILEIDGAPLRSRNEALARLTLSRADKKVLSLCVRREAAVHCCEIHPDTMSGDYIYGTPFNDRYGIHLIGEDIRLASVRTIFEIASRHRAKQVVVLTSMIVRPLLARMLDEYRFLAPHDLEFDLQVVPSRFLGGNIVMGDMLVVDDFRDFLDEYLHSEDPDLVLVPSGAFNHGGWSRDMKGQPFELLRRSSSVPIEMIEAPYFE